MRQLAGRAGALALALAVLGFVVLQACGSQPGSPPTPQAEPTASAPTVAPTPAATQVPHPVVTAPGTEVLPSPVPPPSPGGAVSPSPTGPGAGPPFMGATKSGAPFHPRREQPQQTPQQQAPPQQQANPAPNHAQ